MQSPALVPADPKVVPIRLDVRQPEHLAEAAGRCGDARVLMNHAGIFPGPAAVIAALQGGGKDEYPGRAADIAAALQADPKAVEREFAGLFPVQVAAS